MKEGADKTTPKIYVACLAAYNSGYLHGGWIDAHQEPEQIRAEIALMLARSPIPDAEEYAIHDHEGFEGVEVSEYAGIERVADLASFVSEHGELGSLVLAHFGGDIEQATQALTEAYFGEYRDLADFIQESTENALEIPQSLRFYIDWQAMARDAELNGEVFTIESAHDEVHVFGNV